MSEWTNLQGKLQTALSKEIYLRQEILGNMNQQEYFLLTGEIELKEKFCDECNLLIKSLKKVMKCRRTITQELLDNQPANIQARSLDDLLDPSIEIEEETLLLYHKTKELIHKIHAQQLRNKTLSTTKRNPSGRSVKDLKNEALFTQQRKTASLTTLDELP